MQPPQPEVFGLPRHASDLTLLVGGNHLGGVPVTFKVHRQILDAVSPRIVDKLRHKVHDLPLSSDSDDAEQV
jgi:hypothetical protein